MFGAYAGGSAVFRVTVMAAVLAMMSACGGGGGNAAPDSGGQGTGGAGGDTGGSTDTTVTLAPFVDTPESFHVHVDATYAQAAVLDTLSGGPLFAAWDPTNASGVLDPGMKVMFFGHAAGCDQTAFAAGPVAHGADAAYAGAATHARLAAADAGTPRWVPAGATNACAQTVFASDGPSMVQIDARDGVGSIGLYTNGGTMDDGSAPFLSPWGNAGQDGQGANAYILGTFVTFRQDWQAAHPLQPWDAGVPVRVASLQTLGDTAVGDAGRPSEFVQVKQQMSVTFLNLPCARTLLGTGAPCQIQYLLDTAILRTGVSDWSQVAWFNAGGVMFDPGQGGIPVITGPIGTRGGATTDATTGLELWQSQGNPTQHAAYSGLGFDVRIPFGDLMNAARVVTSRKDQVDVAAVTDNEMSAFWGPSWNDNAQWVLLSSEIGQEVYDPYADKRAYIGGNFSEVFVGPAQ